MFRHILVPLDGTSAAEQALPVAAELARRAGARVTLLHVLEAQPPEAVHGQRHLTSPLEAERYLRQQAQAAFPSGLQVSWHVHGPGMSDVGAGLTFHVGELDADLVVMCSHGRVRLRHRLSGNLAQQVVAGQSAAVLLVAAPRGHAPAFPFRRILVALDGRAEHEAGLRHAAELALLCGDATLLLLTVVPTRTSLSDGQAASAVYLPSATSEVLELRRRQATEYLQRLAGGLSSRGVAVETRVVRGDPSRRIPAVAKHDRADLVVLATHGRAGTEAFWSGSVGAKVLRRVRTSVLLVPAPPPGETAPPDSKSP